MTLWDLWDVPLSWILQIPKHHDFRAITLGRKSLIAWCPSLLVAIPASEMTIFKRLAKTFAYKLIYVVHHRYEGFSHTTLFYKNLAQLGSLLMLATKNHHKTLCNEVNARFDHRRTNMVAQERRGLHNSRLYAIP
jgi:hypothetical protein